MTPPPPTAAEELRRLATRMRRESRKWVAQAAVREGSAMVGYAYSGATWSNAALMLEQRAARLDAKPTPPARARRAR